MMKLLVEILYKYLIKDIKLKNQEFCIVIQLDFNIIAKLISNFAIDLIHSIHKNKNPNPFIDM